MTGYDLPKSLTVGGTSYPIRTDFRAVLDILAAMNDAELDNTAKNIVMLQIIYPNWREIPQEHLQEAAQKAADFIDCGHKDDGKPSPRLIDWEKDATIIIPAVNSVAHAEIRALPELHWWTFLSYFMEIRESTLSTVLNIRQKKAKHKKLDQWERDFCKENKKLVEIKSADDAEIRKAKDNILKFL